MTFEFAKYTEITDLAFKLRSDYKDEGYVRFFICPDVLDYWFVRILKGYDKDYNPDEDSFILERNKIQKDHKSEMLTLTKVKEIILDDDNSNWDYEQSYDINELIDMLDDGFGILNLKE